MKEFAEIFRTLLAALKRCMDTQKRPKCLDENPIGMKIQYMYIRTQRKNVSTLCKGHSTKPPSLGEILPEKMIRGIECFSQFPSRQPDYLMFWLFGAHRPGGYIVLYVYIIHIPS